MLLLSSTSQRFYIIGKDKDKVRVTKGKPGNTQDIDRTKKDRKYKFPNLLFCFIDVLCLYLSDCNPTKICNSCRCRSAWSSKIVSG